ncbi:MAG: hypothetical protein IJ515_03840 [Clostridia bacterium]|nr:hypothetical protein [Clostridia bacterium]
MSKNYRIKTKRIECYPFDEWITKLERRAFGWVDKGMETDYYDEYDVTIDVDRQEATVKQKFTIYNVFRRIEPYSSNLLFKLVELLMSIQSWIRRKLIFLLFGITALALVIGIFQLLGTGEIGEYMLTAIMLLAITYVPSLVYALIGYMLRKVLRLDDKLKDSLEKNGYAREQHI